MAWAQSSLPPCPETGVKNLCFGSDSRDGATRFGEFRSGMLTGRGVLLFSDGRRYVGEFFRDQFEGDGILYGPDGNAIAIGYWSQGRLTNSVPHRFNELRNTFLEFERASTLTDTLGREAQQVLAFTVQ